MKMSKNNKRFISELEGVPVDNYFAERLRDHFYEIDFEERAELFAWLIANLVKGNKLDLETVETY